MRTATRNHPNLVQNPPPERCRSRPPTPRLRDRFSRGSSYSIAQTLKVSAANGVDYAYRSVGAGAPLVLLQHFRRNLDNWTRHSSTS